MTEELSTFQKKLRERRLREERERTERKELETEFEDAIPEEAYELTEADKELDNVIERIDIIDAYIKWCGKMVPQARRGQTEGIKISCPIPGHADKDPSAWINTDNQTWYCGGCAEGGDIHDLAAFSFGYPVPGYKQAGQFPQLRKEMAMDFGYTFTEMPGGAVEVVGPEDTDPESTEQIAESTEEEQKKLEELIAYDDDVIYPHLDWRAITPSGTFLEEYMKACTVDDSVEEFHFFNGLMAIAMAIGRDVRMNDSLPVYGNLFLCTLGGTGTGKSKAKNYMTRVIRDALPYDQSDPDSKGVKIVSTPASAESLIMSFNKRIEDPSDPKKFMGLARVRGVIDFNELSALVSRANRAGSALKPALMEFYDTSDLVSTTSLTTGTKEAFEPYGAVHTTSQLASLQNLVNKGDDDSGFLNRWLFVLGPPKKRFARGGARVDITPAVNPLKAIHGWASSFKHDEYIDFEPEADELFREFFEERIDPAQQNVTHSLRARMDLLVKKLILLFACNKREKVISIETVQTVINMFDYLVACYDLPAKELGKTEVSVLAERILSFAARQYDADGTGVTMSQIARSLWRHTPNAELINRQVDALVKLGMLRVAKTSKGKSGRPTVRYEYVV